MVKKLCLLLVILCLAGCGNIGTSKLYIYTYPTWTGETSYHLTHAAPDKVAEEYDDRMLVQTYSHKGFDSIQIADYIIGGSMLIWDRSWFLYDIADGTETPVGWDEIPDSNKLYLLLGDGKPEAVGIYSFTEKKYAFFSIGADRMISEYEYLDMHHEELIGGKIAVLTEDGAYLLDPLTGELCGEADSSLFEE